MAEPKIVISTVRGVSGVLFLREGAGEVSYDIPPPPLRGGHLRGAPRAIELTECLCKPIAQHAGLLPLLGVSAAAAW